MVFNGDSQAIPIYIHSSSVCVISLCLSFFNYLPGDIEIGMTL